MPVFYQDPKIENAAVFIANVVRNDDVYSSDKTMAEILKAYDEGKFVIFDVNDSGYHFIFTEGTIALTNRTPYQGVFIFGNAMASFSADNATTENNVDYFNMTLESSGSTLPETTEDDNGKVLKVQDGAWAIGDDESTNIEVYDSLDSVPDDLPDGSFVIIPSEEEDSGESDTSGGGLTVVEITTDLSSISGAGGVVDLNADDCAKMVEIFAKGTPYVLNCQLSDGMPCNVLMSIGGITGEFEVSGGSIMMENLEIKIGITGGGGEYALFINLASPS